ncbi:amidohydrolase family protein [Actinomadura rayongensis]|uniref:2-amino-3-carboxymuconate-6-semialdehyde decarboxylase n=1 Tax=Actinomadura rayongensis TaxID=1429076 RepID=A0A6I4WGT7_9ACTN|nr:amidohydrolase family protein [Actinomadura rayongensis]MXQ67545.1 amidohydrolase family protein [Actinomadura rayongensis]
MNAITPAPPRIDVHAHFIVDPPPFAERFGDDRWPSLTKDESGARLVRDSRPVRTLPAAALSLEARLPELDDTGIGHQVLSPAPPMICEVGDVEADAEWARRINLSMVETISDHPGRFSAFGIVPLSHPGEAVKVLAEMKDIGMVGVEIGTTAGTRELDHPDLTEFFQAAAELDLLVFVHPIVLGSTTPWTSRIDTLETTFGLGLTTDTAIAAARLAFGGMLARAPGVKICLAHGGGCFAWALTRIAHLWDANNSISAAELARSFYVDSVVFDPRNLRYLVDRLGADRILFGTDHPMPGSDSLKGDTLAELTPQARRQIESTNALNLLGRRPA